MHIQTANVMLLLSATMVVSSRYDDRGEYEASGDVCNVDGSTCPENKCCRDEICKQDGHGLICCNDPDDNPVECANCPKCSKY